MIKLILHGNTSICIWKFYETLGANFWELSLQGICKEVGTRNSIYEAAIPQQTHYTHFDSFDFHNDLYPTNDHT